MTIDVRVGRLKFIDEIERRITCSFTQVVVNGLVNIFICDRSRNDDLGFHSGERLLTRSRSLAK